MIVGVSVYTWIDDVVDFHENFHGANLLGVFLALAGSGEVDPVHFCPDGEDAVRGSAFLTNQGVGNL